MSSMACCTNINQAGCSSQSEASSSASSSRTSLENMSKLTDNNNIDAAAITDNGLEEEEEEEMLSLRSIRPVDVVFKDVGYSVLDVSVAKLRIGRKEILHGVSGHFRAGQLTAIMGPSGAGKSSLLNVIAGYVRRGVSGAVEMRDANEDGGGGGDERIRAKGDKARTRTSGGVGSASDGVCRYIHQDDKQRPWLTVREAMVLAAALKLDRSTTEKAREHRISELLTALGLSAHASTLTGRLSGGQRKRLSIALEMISDPAVLFLDEPTTGLDSSSCAQCVRLLRTLARQGRTVVCTVHQPSALLFERFDQLYVLVEGHAFYRGAPRDLVRFLTATTGLHCPKYHNPADFMMEVATGDYGADIAGVVSACSKLYALEQQRAQYDKHGIEGSEKLAVLKEMESLGGNVDAAGQLLVALMKQKQQLTRKQQQKQQLLPVAAATDGDEIVKPLAEPATDDDTTKDKMIRKPSFFRQFALLYRRQLLGERRNYSLPVLRLVAHMLIGVLFGYLYRNVGDSADTALANYIYLYGTMLLLVYTGKMSVTLNFPLEMETLAREHFNRWYNLAPYYLSVILFEIPFQILCTLVYVACSYYLTGNLLDWFRVGCFVGIAILGSLCGQSWGYFIGASTPVKIAVFLGPVVAVLFSVFGFCLWYADIPYALKWLFHLSYFRAAFQGLVATTYGFNRTMLPCPEDKLYCHYKYTKRFLMEADATDIVLSDNLWFVSGTIVVMHALTVAVVWLRLNKR